MKQKKYTFFTEEFYNNKSLALEVLNKCLEENFKHINDYDTYTSGEILFWDMKENEETKEILKPIISDLEAFKKENAEQFVTDDDTEIGLHFIASAYDEFYRNSIMYDESYKLFMSYEEYFDCNC